MPVENKTDTVSADFTLNRRFLTVRTKRARASVADRNEEDMNRREDRVWLKNRCGIVRDRRLHLPSSVSGSVLRR